MAIQLQTEGVLAAKAEHDRPKELICISAWGMLQLSKIAHCIESRFPVICCLDADLSLVPGAMGYVPCVSRRSSESSRAVSAAIALYGPLCCHATMPRRPDTPTVDCQNSFPFQEGLDGVSSSASK